MIHYPASLKKKKHTASHANTDKDKSASFAPAPKKLKRQRQSKMQSRCKGYQRPRTEPELELRICSKTNLQHANGRIYCIAPPSLEPSSPLCTDKWATPLKFIQSLSSRLPTSRRHYYSLHRPSDPTPDQYSPRFPSPLDLVDPFFSVFPP